MVSIQDFSSKLFVGHVRDYSFVFLRLRSSVRVARVYLRPRKEEFRRLLSVMNSNMERFTIN